MAANISELWQQWQRDNKDEAAAIRERFTTIACTGPFKRAMGWLAKVVSEKLSRPAVEVWVYVLRNRGD